MENLVWALGLLALQFVFLAYVMYNFEQRDKLHEGLKNELGRILYVRSPQGNFDVLSIVNALLIYQKLKIRGSTGVEVVKDEFLRKK